MTDRYARQDPWGHFKSLTPARIALGRSGGSLPTRQWLNFRYDHALARDAVHRAFELEPLEQNLRALGVETLVVGSRAKDRAVYLKRPDLGRRLSESARRLLESRPKGADLVIILSDGLSAEAAHRQALPLLMQLLPRLRSDQWKLAPLILAAFGRVALEDEIGQILGARLALILLGERPGLGSPDSLGAYLVYKPRIGNSDAQRNCVSNIRPEGLDHGIAAETLHYLLTQARRLQLTGIALKDERRGISSFSPAEALPDADSMERNV